MKPNHAAALALLDKITPGPWTARLNGSVTAYYIKGADGIHVCGMSWHKTNRRFYTLRDESRSNARAIAAVPELADAWRKGVEMRRCVRNVRAIGDLDINSHAELAQAEAAFDAALAAVADKLNGEGK